MQANKQVIHGQLQGGAYEGADKIARSLNGHGLGRSVLLNPLFRNNFRGLTGTITLTAGQRGHTCWKAGASGCTYTVTGGFITISSGSLLQVIDGQNLSTGVYTLSNQSGSSPIRIGTQAWSNSPQSANCTIGSNINVEFGIGTVNSPAFEPGRIATPFLTPMLALEVGILSYYTTNGEL